MACRSRDFISDCRPQQYPSDACGVSRFVLWPLRNGKWRKTQMCRFFGLGGLRCFLRDWVKHMKHMDIDFEREIEN